MTSYSTKNGLKLALLISLLKCLFIPLYRSTDFEVHRNWLAITYSLPVSQWYQDETSPWTLDYPPLFAWFEFILSHVAKFFDPQMLDLNNLNYASEKTIVFQRLSVVCTDLVFIYAALQFVSYFGKKKYSSPHQFGLLFLLIANAGLLIVDHIHFQYNGLLFGVLLLSVLRICQGRYLEGAFWFSVLLNMKHIYLYMAPAFFVYLLQTYCFSHHSKGGRVIWRSFSVLRFLSLGLVVISVFLVSFGPFIALDQVSQVLTRLFPFKRGLCHAYWAPNVWALYNMADKVLYTTGVQGGFISAGQTLNASMTGGLVQEQRHSVLPTPTPPTTLLITAFVQLPVLVHTWRRPSGSRGFLRCLVLCAYASFMFGWHVHEKAVLLITVPLTLLSCGDWFDARAFILLSTVSHVSLFPLLFTPQETLIKYSLALIYTIAAFSILSFHRLLRLSTLEKLYLLSLVPVETYCSFIHPLITSSLPFLPLLITSVWCGLGVLYTWLVYYRDVLTDYKVRCVKVE